MTDVSACSGTFSDGISEASYLCADGYHICEDANEVGELGVSRNECFDGHQLHIERGFYATLQGSSVGTYCDGNGTEDVSL